MIKLVKNEGHLNWYKGKYVLHTDEFEVGKLYAVPNLWNLFDYLKAKLKRRNPTVVK